MIDLSIWQYLYLIAGIGFAALVHGAMGIGFPMVATPLIAVLMDVRLAIILTLLPTVVVNVASILGSKNPGPALRPYFNLFSSTLLGSVVGTMMLMQFDAGIFRVALAGLIILFLGIRLFGDHLSISQKVWTTPNNKPVMMLFGFVAGISAGTTNVMVAILIIYMFGLGLNRPQMIPVLNSCFLVGKLCQIVMLSYAGLISLTVVQLTIPLAGIALGALVLGRKVGERLPMASYHRILYALLFALAVMLVIQFVIEV